MRKLIQLAVLLTMAQAAAGQIVSPYDPCKPNSADCVVTGDQFLWTGDPIEIGLISGDTITTREELKKLLAQRDEEIRKLRRALELVRELRAMEAELRRLEAELLPGDGK